MTIHPAKITRIGVYGVIMDKERERMLLIRQHRGPYAGKLDFPGGGIEFGESPEEALRRELSEEVAMECDSLELLKNLTAVVDVPKTPSNEPYIFYQIGMIYRVQGYKNLDGPNKGVGEYDPLWVDLKTMDERECCSALLWKYKNCREN